MMLILVFTGIVSAQEAKEDRTYTFDLTVNGEHEVQVQPGQTITVVFTLQRTDKDEPYTMYAMQNEIKYDENFVKLVENGSIVATDIQTQDIALRTGGRELYMNYVSFSDGTQWTANQIVGSFQMQILGTDGATTISNENYKVTVQDGSEVYEADAKDLTLIVSNDCTVTFVTNTDSEIDPVTVTYGSKIERPEDPQREGYEVEGWFKDKDLTEEWKFEEDSVTSNMILYAKWKEEEKVSFLMKLLDWIRKHPWILAIPVVLLLLLLLLLLAGRKCKVIFETNGGSPISPMTVKKNSKLTTIPQTTRNGSVFGGWYKDAKLTKPWYADVDQVKKKKTRLYAKWR